MTRLERSIDVDVPLRTVYDQWMAFERFPDFMQGVKSVRQLDDKRMNWRAEIGGRRVEWSTETTQNEPDSRIAWRSTSGASNSGIVTFFGRTPSTTVVTLRLEYAPEGALQTLGSWFGLVGSRIQGDLGRFKAHSEASGREAGGWRSKVHGDQGPSRVVVAPAGA